MSQIKLKWKKLHPKAEIPSRATSGAAGFDFRACMDAAIELKKGEVVAVPTGLCVEVPLGYELQVRARSGLAFKNGVMLVNGVGTIDADYRGEVRILLTTIKDEVFRIEPGDRIAQGLVSAVLLVDHCEERELSLTDRGVGGFGSTGVR